MAVNANGSSGSAPGGGGGGGRSNGSTWAIGGDGGAGKVILTYTVAYDHVNVETAANGGGSTVSAQTLSSGNSITVYAIVRESDNTYIANVAATWSLIGKAGGVADSDLIASGDAKSAVFTAHLGGSAQINAAFGAITANPSGTITVPSTGTVGAWNADSDGNWTDATKWDSNPSVPSVAGDTAILGVGSVLRTVTLDANETIGTISFTNSSSFVVSGANTLTLDKSGSGALIQVAGGTANDIQVPVSLNDNTTATASSGKSLLVSGNIANTSGSKTLTVNGAGTLALSGNNSYGPSAGSIGTMLSGGGTLQVRHNNALGAGDLNVAGNGTIQAGAAGLSVANNISVASSVTATVDNSSANSLTLSGTIGGSGAVTKTSNGTLTLAGANTHSGGTTIGGGVVSVSSDGASAGNSGNLGVVPASATANNVVLNGGDLLGNGTFTLHPNRGIGIGATSGSTAGTGLIDAAAGASFTVAGVIASAGNTGANNLTVNSQAGSSGTVVLSGANTFSGTTIVSAGTLTLGNSLALQNSTLNYNNQGGSLSFGSLTAATLGGLSGAQDLSLLNGSSAAVTLSVGNNNASTTYSGILSGASAALTKLGTGTTILTGANTYSGATAITSGVLQLDSGGVINSLSIGLSGVSGVRLVVSGGSLTATNTCNIAAPSSGLLVSSGSATFLGGLTENAGNSSQASTDAPIIATGGTLTLGSLAMGRTGASVTAQPTTGATTYGLYVNGATVNVTGNVSLGTQSAANSTANARIDSGSMTVGGSFVFGLNNGGRWTPVDVNGGSLTVNDTATGINIGSGFAGNAILLLRAGTITAGRIGLGNGTIADTVVLSQSGGSLYVGSGGIVQVSPNATASVTLANGTLGAAADWSSSMPMTLNAMTVKAADASSVARNITLSGVLSGTTLTKTGGGTLTLASVGNNFSGLTTINGGTLNINSEWALGGANYAGLTFSGSGGTLQYASTLLNSTTDFSTQPVTLGVDATVDVNGHAIAFANAIGNSGAGGLTIASSAPGGTLALNGANTYTGLTTVSSGTLGGTGSLAGGLIVGSGGTLAAGNSIGAFTVNGAAAIDGTVVAELGSGSSADLVNFAGGATINPGSTLNVISAGSLTPGTTFNLFDGAISGTFGTVNLPGAPSHWNTANLYSSGEISFINNAPTASNFGLGVSVGQSVTAAVIGKFAPALDADSEAVTITSVSTPANGTATIVGGTGITYTSTSAAAGDSFTYTVSDGLSTATATVTVTISSPAGFNLISGPAPVGGGQYQFDYLGVPGHQYAIEETASIAPPITWTPVATNTAAGNGSLSFTITPGNPSGYFRTRALP